MGLRLNFNVKTVFNVFEIFLIESISSISLKFMLELRNNFTLSNQMKIKRWNLETPSQLINIWGLIRFRNLSVSNKTITPRELF